MKKLNPVEMEPKNNYRLESPTITLIDDNGKKLYAMVVIGSMVLFGTRYTDALILLSYSIIDLNNYDDLTDKNILKLKIDDINDINNYKIYLDLKIIIDNEKLKPLIEEHNKLILQLQLLH